MNLDPTVITSTDLLTLFDQRTPSQFLVRNEEYVIPSSGKIYLRENALKQQAVPPTGVTVVQVPGSAFTETLTTPAFNQFQVNYSDGSILFNAGNVGNTVLVTYTAIGSIVHAWQVNNLQTPLVPFYNNFNTITVTGTSPNLNFTFPNNVIINGNLDIVGIITRDSTEVINIRDQIIFLNQNVVADTGIVGLEISIGNAAQGSSANPQLVWNESASTWNFNSTSSGPYSPSTGAVFKVYNKGGVQVTKLTSSQETTLAGTLSSGDAGLQWFNTTDNQFKGWNGTAIVILG